MLVLKTGTEAKVEKGDGGGNGGVTLSGSMTRQVSHADFSPHLIEYWKAEPYRLRSITLSPPRLDISQTSDAWSRTWSESPSVSDELQKFIANLRLSGSKCGTSFHPSTLARQETSSMTSGVYRGWRQSQKRTCYEPS